MYKICIITQTHLVNNPRVVKEANALKNHGYDVEVLTIWTSQQKFDLDIQLNTSGFKYSAAVDLIPDKISFLKVIYHKAFKKLGSLLYRYFKISIPFNLIYAPFSTLSEAVKRDADLYIGHTETGLWVCNKLAKYGKKVAFDFEDWYSKDYLNKYRPVRYLQSLEEQALSFGKYVTCPSSSMAFAISKFYDKQRSSVIYNGFSLCENKYDSNLLGVRTNFERISFCWFSQTIGSGRGLELLIEALNTVDFSYEFHLFGNCSNSFKIQLLQLHKPKEGQEIFFHALVPHKELLPLITEQDVGFALELNHPPSRKYTITNKILQYLQAGLLVISSNTKGQCEVAELCENVILFDNENQISLINALNNVNRLFSLGKINKGQSTRVFEQHFAWEVQEQKFLKIVELSILE